MTTRLVRLLLALVLSLAAACAPSAGASRKADTKTTASHLETVAARAEKTPKTLILAGTLTANQESDVAANATGRVLRTFVERGSSVQRNAPLAQLDTRMSALAAAEAQANCESAAVQRALANSECERSRRLFAKGGITQDELDKATANCGQTAAAADAADARYRQMSETVADATIRAPFAGQVGERFVSVGEYVRADTKIVRLVQSDPMRVELTVPEAQVGAIEMGLEVRFQVAAFPGRTFAGTVRHVSPSLRSATRDLLFEAVVPNGDGSLKSGMFVTAHVDVGAEDLPVVPKTALRRDGDAVRAFAVKNGRLEERIVQCGETVGDRVAIRNGIAAGERVVVDATQKLVDGMVVE